MSSSTRHRSSSFGSEPEVPSSPSSPGDNPFHALADNTMVGFWQVCPDGQTLYINKAMCRMLDVASIEDLRGRSFREFFTAKSLEVMGREHARRAHGEASSYQVELVSDSGAHRHVIISGAPIMDDAGKLHSLIGTFIDITERQQAEHRLRQSEERYRGLVEEVRLIAWEFDRATQRFTFVSHFAEAILGYSSDQWQAPNFWIDHLHAADRQAIDQACREHIERGEDYEIEYRMIHADGSVVWVREITRVVIENGAATSLRGVFIDITERKRAEQKREEAERKYHSLFDQSPNGVLIIDPDTERVLETNQALQSILGYSAEQMAGMRLADFDSSQSPQEIHSRIRQVLAQGADEFQMQVRSLHGDLRDVMVRAKLVDLQGAPRILSTVRDITERKRAEKALHEVEQKLRTVVTHAPLVLWSINSAGVITLSEGQALEALGFTGGQLVGQNVFELYRDRPDIIDLQRRVLSGEQVSQVTMLGDVTLESRISPLHDSQGRVIGAIGVAVDVTERTRAVEALRRSEEQLRSVFDSAVDPLWDWDVVRDHTMFSPSWPRMLGYRPGELDTRSLTWEQLVHPDDYPQVMARLKQCLNAERPEYEAEYRVRTRSGGWIWALSRGRVVQRDKHRQPLRMIGSISDITERKRAEQKLRESYDFQRLVLSELDHRVRNNLASLSALIDLTARGTADVREFANSIKGRVQAMTSVHSLLSRGHWHPIRLQDLLLAVMPMDVRNAVHFEGPDVMIGHRQVTALGMIFQELLANSMKYGAMSVPTGRVQVGWSVGDPHADDLTAVPLTLTWTEHGGPAPAATTRRGVGTGLIEGLARAELRGRAELRYPPEGATHRFALTLDRSA